jgi:hypothetical protein
VQARPISSAMDATYGQISVLSRRYVLLRAREYRDGCKTESEIVEDGRLVSRPCIGNRRAQI